MTPLRDHSRASGYFWNFPVVSIALSGFLVLPGGRLAYLVGVSVVAVLAACWIAVDDCRTGLLRDRWTGPFALAGLIQVVLASAGLQAWLDIAAPGLVGATVTTSLYGIMGLLGWVGFGDVKFAAGLSLFVAIPAGWTGLCLLPLALAASALPRLLHGVARKPQSLRPAHGPALAAALAILMSAGCLKAG